MVKDNNKNKGLKRFFRKEKGDEKSSGSSGSSFSAEIGDAEKIRDLFVQDQTEPSGQEDLSQLIEKIKTQKSGLENIDLKNRFENEPEKSTGDKREDLTFETIPEKNNLQPEIITKKPLFETEESQYPDADTVKRDDDEKNAEAFDNKIMQDTLKQEDENSLEKEDESSEINEIIRKFKKSELKPQKNIEENIQTGFQNNLQNNEVQQVSSTERKSELENILGRIKASEGKTVALETQDDSVETETENPEEIFITEEEPAVEQESAQTIIIEEKNESNDTDVHEITESNLQNGIISKENLNPEEEQVSGEEEKPEKKYQVNRTKWSQPEPEIQDEKTPVEEDKTEERTLYSAKKTRWSESDQKTDEEDAGLVSVDDIDYGYSGLILPEGATFEIDEFRVKSSKKTELSEDDETLAKIDKIYSEYFPPIDLEKIGEIDLSEETPKEKKSKISGLFKAEKLKKQEYNPSIHGPIVDLSFNEPEGVEEIELYPVNEPYAYVRIVYDKNTNEYIYKALEPVLNNAENKLLAEIEQRLFETLNVNTKELTKEKAREILKDYTNEIISDYGIKLSPAEKEKILYHINREFLGDGLIDPIMHDKYIEDISCDGLNTPIFVFHSNYESLQTNLVYKDALVLDSFVTKLAQKAGKYISIAEPMLDATMTDGSRIQMTLGSEVTAHGSTFTIRKFKDEPITPTDLTEWGTFSPLSIAYIWLAVEAGKSCIFAGGTASGKTTSLNAISLFIPPLAKIVTLEDTRELKLPHQNWIPSITRESFDKDGKGSIDMYELLRAALRQRPEYILVGEVRGAEAQTLFQAMSTGHVTYATMHADSVASAVHRIENPPLNVPRNMLSSLDLMSVQVQARIGGQRIRRNKQLIEILDIDPRTKELITNEVFKWHQSTDEIRYSGKSYVLEDIMEARGWDEARMVEELKRRQEILEWMRLKKLRNYKDVGKVLMSYFRDSEAVINLVRKDLYE